MKLKKDFLAIGFYQNPKAREVVFDYLMDQGKSIFDFAQMIERRKSLNLVLSNSNHKLYYLSQKFQEHADLIKFNKISLGWFRNIKTQSRTYILNKDEFYRFYVDEKNAIYILYYRKTLMNGQDYIKFDTFVIRINEDEYPEGYMPDNEWLGQKIEDKVRFVKLLLFTELSDILVVVAENNRKVKLDSQWDKRFEGRVRNESGVDVTLVDTSWNKVFIRTEGFSVSPHIRIQPWGPGRTYYRPVWIEEYEKKGYVRGANRIKKEGE